MVTLQEKRLNTTKKFVAITTNVVVIGVIATTKKKKKKKNDASRCNKLEAVGLCNTKFSLQ